jgi:hypothetical protein
MSALGTERSPLLASKVGTIKSIRRNSRAVFVLFDGNKTPTAIHRGYIELTKIDEVTGQPSSGVG